MIKIKSSIGNRSTRITQYEFIIDSKVDLLLFIKPWIERRNDGSLLYELKLTKNGYLHLIVGAGSIALIKSNAIGKVKIRACKILVELSANFMGAMSAIIKIKHNNLLLETMQGDDDSYLKLQCLYNDYSLICTEASAALYSANVELNNYRV